MAVWTYILKCADDSYYVGCTTHLLQRFGQHQSGEMGGYTASRRPVEMVWSEEFQTMDQAIAMERQLKRWSRLKKEAVIRGDFDALPALSKKGFKPSKSS
jgi:predicted GIY-YIG superfamily endonuclease